MCAFAKKLLLVVIATTWITTNDVNGQENVALGRPASQTSDLFFGGFLWSAGLAVDGCLLRDVPDTQQCCSCSQEEAGDNYWRVDLAQLSTVQTITVYGRSDTAVQLEGFQVFIQNQVSGPELLVYDNTGVPYDSGIFTITLDPPVSALSVTLRRPGVMTLCEVQVFSVPPAATTSTEASTTSTQPATTSSAGCPDGFYGPQCTSPCGNCKDGATCEVTIGVCPVGCQPGWQIPFCNMPCPDFTYGEDCLSSCGNCFNGESCDKVTGQCNFGCAAGWIGVICDSPCPGGLYGVGCSQTCGNCANGNPCDPVTGACVSCAAGWQGLLCDTPVPTIPTVITESSTAAAIVNIALGRSTSQTSDLFFSGFLWSSDLAVDGCLLRDSAETQQCCSCSQEQAGDNYWRVDLAELSTVQTITVYGRSDNTNQLEDFQVFIQNQAFGPELLVYDNTGAPYDTGIFTITLDPPASVLSVIIRRPGILTLCEVQVFPALQTTTVEPEEPTQPATTEATTTQAATTPIAYTNVAQGKPASQLEDVDYIYFWTAGLAVDGCYLRDDPDNQRCCSSSLGTTDNFWRVDLQQQYTVNRIVVYGRDIDNDQLANFLLFIQLDEMWPELQVYTNAGVVYGDGVFTINLEPAETVRYVKLTRPSSNILTICEVEVYGVPVSQPTPDAGTTSTMVAETTSTQPATTSAAGCPDGFYGPQCTSPCGNCKDGATCEVTIGVCPVGCEPGWQIPFCNMPCPDFTYGDDCLSSCGNCFNGESCDKVTGQCNFGCAAGWIGVSCDSPCPGGLYGAGCSQTCGNCANGDPCDPVTGACVSCAAGWQGLLCDTPIPTVPTETTELSTTAAIANIALNKPASQLWDLNYLYLWTADKAVDGCTLRDDPDTQMCCSSSQGTSNNYWRVDLEQEYLVNRIIVYGRTEGNQLEGFLISVQADEGVEENVYDNTGIVYGDGIFIVDLVPVRTARHVILTRPSGSILTLCEVEVYGVPAVTTTTAPPTTTSPPCEDGFYGPECVPCGACQGGVPCDKDTGICPAGCAAGWQFSPLCDIPCTDGTYGGNCAMFCGNCLNGGACDKVTGVCFLGCAAGWQTGLCDTPCTDGTHGPNCALFCGSCQNGDSCNKETGLCPAGCAAGWQPPLCDSPCASGSYGLNCMLPCGNCLNGDPCDTVSGQCMFGCAPGWLGTNCDSACPGGFYGAGCTLTCGNCLNGDPCEAVSGQCVFGCASGWLGTNCDAACPGGFYGAGCTQTCGNCANGDPCDPVTGACVSCAAGWQGLLCDTPIPTIPTAPTENTDSSTSATIENVALGSPTSQTSDLFFSDFLWSSDRAVDGCLLRDSAETQQCCSCSQEQAGDNYWRVDLAELSTVQTITVYGRSDNTNQLEDFQVFIQNQQFGPELLVYDNAGAPYDTGIFTITLDPPASVLSVVIRRPGILTLCEVQVFAVSVSAPTPDAGTTTTMVADTTSTQSATTSAAGCPDGFYGPQCTSPCGNCKDGATCEVTIGVCPVGCQPGWQIPFCNMPCPDFTYGEDCLSSCGNCFNGESCDKVTGQCNFGCAAGWIGVICDSPCPGGLFGAGCTQTCGNCANGDPCDPVTGACVSCATGWQGLLCDTPIPTIGTDPTETTAAQETTVNVALNKPASQLSDLDYVYLWTADKAVDGCTLRDDPDTQMCCSSTQGTTDNFWQVDLLQQYTVSRIVVYGRIPDAAQLDGFLVSVQRDIGLPELQVYSNVGVEHGDGIFTIDVTPPEVARFVKLTRPTGTILTLCEVEVYAVESATSTAATSPSTMTTPTSTVEMSTAPPVVCQDGFYGESCVPCGNCGNGLPCDKVTGVCPAGCGPGWQSPLCDMPCSDGFFGTGCAFTCGNCFLGQSCDKVTGECPFGCDPGWISTTCDSACPAGFYGDGCMSSCGNCANGDVCDHVTGACVSCAPGWEGILCDTELASSTAPTSTPAPEGQNVALNKPATQLSALDYIFLWTADKGVDGCTLQDDPDTQMCCAATQGTTDNFWRVDLLQQYTVDRIVVYGRDAGSTQLSDFIVYVEEGVGSPAVPVYDNTGIDYGNGIFTIPVNPPRVVRAVKLMRPTGDIMTICEVQVFEAVLTPTSTPLPSSTATTPTTPSSTVATPSSTAATPSSTSASPSTASSSTTSSPETTPGPTAPPPVEENVALNKPASQLSDLDYLYLWTADKAVDGCTLRDNPDTQMCCSSTQGTTDNFWQVDLLQQYTVSRIVVYGRGDDEGVQLSGFFVYTQEDDFITEELEYNNIGVEYGDGTFSIDLDLPKPVRYVKLMRPTADIMTICEVEVYGVPVSVSVSPSTSTAATPTPTTASVTSPPTSPTASASTAAPTPGGCLDGFYGNPCQPCGNCGNGVPCDQVTGACPSGCAAGWQGILCDTECTTGFYGDNCLQTCGNCLGGVACNSVTGTCLVGCEAGWQGPQCVAPCPGGFYGDDCLSMCGNCLNGEACDKPTGVCSSGCAPGWLGQYCIIPEEPPGSSTAGSTSGPTPGPTQGSTPSSTQGSTQGSTPGPTQGSTQGSTLGSSTVNATPPPASTSSVSPGPTTPTTTDNFVPGGHAARALSGALQIILGVLVVLAIVL